MIFTLLIAGIIYIVLLLFHYVFGEEKSISGGEHIYLPSMIKTFNFYSQINFKSMLQKADLINTLVQIPDSMKYMSTMGVLKFPTHNGQLKLFLTELEFLTMISDGSDNIQYVLYSGSAPSNKLSYLMYLFPKVKFILVDPNQHMLMFSDGDQYDKKYIEKLLYFRLSYEQNCPGYTMRENHDEYLVNLYDKGIVNRDDKYASDLPANIAELIQSLDYQVYLIEDYMTDDIAKLIAPIKNLYYISDIRSNSTEDTGPSNLDVMWNNAMQYNWIKIMSPKKYMIKFRCPYEHNYNKVAQEYNGRSYMKEAFDNCAIPFLDNEKNKKFEYLDGDIYIQAFAGPTSTETRIIGDSLKVKEYNIYDYEDKIFCYNRTYRSLGWFTSHEKYLNKYPVLCEDIGIDRCGDCARMCHIFEQYLDKYPSISESPVHMTQNLLSWIDRSIKTGGHGIYHTQYKNRDDFMSKIPFNLNYFKLRKLFRKPLSGNMGLNLAWKYLNMERPLFNLTDLYDREVCDQYYDELPNNYDVKRKDNVIMTTDEKIVLPTQITSDQDAIDYALGRNAAKYDKFHKLEELFADGVEITTSKSSAMSSDNYPKQFLTNRNIFHTNSRCILVTIQIFTEDYLMYYLEVLQRLRKPILMITYQTTQFIKRANNNLISYKMSNVDDALRKQILEIIEN